MYEVRIAGRWWPAAWRDGYWYAILSRDATGFLGILLGGEAMASRLREGSARVVAGAA